MRSKIVALSKNEEFKSLLKKKKVSNKYATIFFGELDKKNNELLSKEANLAFPIKDGIPILLIEEARKINRSL